LRTLGEIAEYLGGTTQSHVNTTPAPVSETVAKPQIQATPAPKDSKNLNTEMLAVVAEKTGYPAEMLDLNMALEADLGIDSIKRVEIRSAIEERVPVLRAPTPAAIAILRTLGEIAAYLAGDTPKSTSKNQLIPASIEA